MRITFLLPPVNLTGGLRVVAIYAKALSSRGHKIVLVSPPPPVASVRTKIKSLLAGRRWPRPTPTASPFNGLGLDHRILERWRPIVDSDLPDADVVIATWWETAEWANRLSKQKGAKVYFVQGHEVYDFLPIARCRATYKMPLRKIVISRWLAEIMSSEYGETAFDLVHNGIDSSRFHATPRGKQPVPTLGFLYHRTSVKGVDIALKVIASLYIKFPNLRVLSFGAQIPEDEPLFDTRIEFHHLPTPEELRQLYATCDVWLTASRSEGFNLTAMEAMACRTPVVSTRTGWPAESIESGQNGVLTEVDDQIALEAGTAWLLTLPDTGWRKVSELSHASVRDCSWENATERFESALANACGRHPHIAGHG
jgi:glycosyltransferase involved in cell wall biosynthesis